MKRTIPYEEWKTEQIIELEAENAKLRKALEQAPERPVYRDDWEKFFNAEYSPWYSGPRAEALKADKEG